ncbi:MAG TPA: glycosyltransferase [Anaerolineales bacterium]
MRIVYLTQSYPPMISGAALFVQQVAEAMTQRGHQVLVIAASDRDHPYLVQNGNLTVLRLQSIYNPMRVGQRFLLYPRREVMKALHDFHPEVIHVHEPLQIGLLGIEYAARADIPSILTIHQLPSFVASYLPNLFKAYVETVLWAYARWLSQKFTSILTPSQTISTLVTEMTGLPANTIGYGMDLHTFRPLLSCDEDIAIRQKWDLPPGVPILLHVGRLDAEKRVDHIIHAAARTLKETDAHLLIIGDGTQKPALIKLCKSLGITARVHFPGYISKEDGLPEIYRIASLFVTASEIETQGIVLLEAAASGLPIVAVRATCIPEIVHHGINGYLAESADFNGLSNGMSMLLKDPQKAKLMGRASLALAAKHDLHYTNNAHDQLYSQLVRQVRTQRVEAETGFPYRFWKRMKAWTSFSK